MISGYQSPFYGTHFGQKENILEMQIGGHKITTIYSGG